MLVGVARQQAGGLFLLSVILLPLLPQQLKGQQIIGGLRMVELSRVSQGFAFGYLRLLEIPAKCQLQAFDGQGSAARLVNELIALLRMRFALIARESA